MGRGEGIINVIITSGRMTQIKRAGKIGKEINFGENAG